MSSRGTWWRNVSTVVASKEANMQMQKTWGEILVIEMAKEGMTASDLAKRCGVEVRAVEAWRANERAPSGSALPRLYGALRVMRNYGVHLAALRLKLRGEGDDGTAEVDEPPVKMAGPIEPAPMPERLVKVERAKPELAPAPVAAEVPQEAAGPTLTFGRQLRAARKRQGLMLHELGELLDTSKDVVKNMERDVSHVGAERLQKIADLFPEMAGVKPSPTLKAKEATVSIESETSEKPKRPWRSFGQALRAARVALGQDRRAFARSAGVGPSSMVGWEADLYAPGDDAMAKLRAYVPALANAPQPRRRRPGPKPGTPRRARSEVVAEAKVKTVSPTEALRELTQEAQATGLYDAPVAKPEASPLRRWLACVKAVRGAEYRGELVEMLRLAGQNGLSLDDVVDAVALVANAIGYGRVTMEAGEMAKIERDELGRIVREAWVEWAKTDPRSARRPDWLAPYDDLAEADKEADRCIGEAVAKAATERLAGEVERLGRELAEQKASDSTPPVEPVPGAPHPDVCTFREPDSCSGVYRCFLRGGGYGAIGKGDTEALAYDDFVTMWVAAKAKVTP